jgi:hypothetical protein
MANVIVACPQYGGQVSGDTARSLWETPSRQHTVRVAASSYSLLNYNCNSLWCVALNNRHRHDLTWFAMLHADIVPQPWWIDTLIAEAEKHGADFLSAVVPFKDHSGITSTAIAQDNWRNGSFCRLTMRQVWHPQFPETFDALSAAQALENLPGELQIRHVPRSTLFANTGCMVCRLDRPWCERICFETFDGITKIGEEYRPVCLSEDWVFAHRIQEHGGKVMSTRLIKLIHRGTADFHSDQSFGQPSALS